ncbi:1,4-alpha-glucan-branching enzyme, chloroplastic/amyloplastic-like isoform X2 [Miscanthus floridulus]|uniref:1,4-alpha-glucan-branching enzyme, chloroplastic/amyloplastic-like isoform X2 n=1 Tax=Miscanthus floridulus TaxID=154761 RepID=UPI00345A1C73
MKVGGGYVRLSVLFVQCEARRSGVQKVKSNATASTVQQDKTMATARGDVDHRPIYIYDQYPKLDKFKDHFSYQIKRFLDQRGSIEENEGSLEEFSKDCATTNGQ